MNNTALGNGIEGIFAEEAIKGCSDSQKPRLGYTCTYVPTEILEAAGFIPVRIAPEPSSEKADSFLDPNFCPYVRACLGKAMQGGYEDLVGIVIANACDGMRRLLDAWRYYVPNRPAFFLDLPRVVNALAVDYFKRQLTRLVNELQQNFKVQVTRDSLIRAISETNRTRRLYETLLSHHVRKALALPYSKLLGIFQKEHDMPRQSFNEVLEKIIQTQSRGRVTDHEGVGVFITGSMLDGDSIITLVEGLGGDIVGVDCCMAERRVENVPLDHDLLRALSDSYLKKLPCARMKDTQKRIEYLLAKMKGSGGQGLIYTALKFCDPYLYEFPYLKAELQRWGIPSLFLEGEYRGRAGGGLRTRVQAFVEMLEKKRS